MARGHLFEGLQNDVENKSEGNENRLVLGDFNHILNKMDRDGENKTQRLYWCGFNYALSKLMVDNGIVDLRRRETRYLWVSPTTIDPKVQDTGKTVSIVILKLVAIPKLIA